MSAIILGAIGGKLLDKVLDTSFDNAIDKITKQKIVEKNKSIQRNIYDALIEENKEEYYYENLMKLLDETGIIKVLFDYSFFSKDSSMEERQWHINTYIDEFYEDKALDKVELKIIKGKINQQFEACFALVNELSDESRRLLNQLIVQIASSRDVQKEILDSLKYDNEEIKEGIASIISLLAETNKPENTEFILPLAPSISAKKYIKRKDDELADLHKKLRKNEKVTIISGMGGIGKTELCKKYVEEYKLEYNNIIWIDYENNLKESFVSEIKYMASINEPDLEIRYLKIRNYLNSLEKPTLLIIDNANTLDDIEVKEIKSYIFKVLLTSRSIYNSFESYPLGFLKDKECRELFYTYYTGKKNNKDLKEIIKIAGNHTLAVELLAKIATNARMSIDNLHKTLCIKGFNIEDEVKIQDSTDSKALLEYLCCV